MRIRYGYVIYDKCRFEGQAGTESSDYTFIPMADSSGIKTTTESFADLWSASQAYPVASRHTKAKGLAAYIQFLYY
jgi:hypothetical protein